jgi:hypothetical protein
VLVDFGTGAAARDGANYFPVILDYESSAQIGQTSVAPLRQIATAVRQILPETARISPHLRGGEGLPDRVAQVPRRGPVHASASKQIADMIGYGKRHYRL